MAIGNQTRSPDEPEKYCLSALNSGRGAVDARVDQHWVVRSHSSPVSSLKDCPAFSTSSLRRSDPYPPHLPMTHAPFPNAGPGKQIPFS